MVQFPLFAPVTDWTAPNLDELPDWAGFRRVAVDIETCDPDLKKTGIGVRRKGYITGISFALQSHEATPASLEEAPAFYLPIAHQGGGNLDRSRVFAYLRKQAATFRGDIVGANLPYDLDYLAEEDIVFTPRFFRDVQVAAPLIYELHHSFSLDNVARRAGFEGKDESHLKRAAEMFGVDHKAEMWKLPAKHVGGYAEVDARLPLRVLEAQEREIVRLDDADPVDSGATLWSLYDLESRVLPILVKMRRRGVRIDFDQLDRMETRCQREAADSMDELSRLTGVRLTLNEINKAAALGPALESVLGRMPKTAKGQVQLNAETFRAYDHPAMHALARARKFNKVARDFVSGIRTHVVGDRLHCSFNQLRATKDSGESKGTITGRLSSSDLNIQQQPARDPKIGPEWRAIYLPDGDGMWTCADYSQQEPRWLVHWAEVTACTGATAAADRYRNDPRTDNHTMMTQIIFGEDAWASWDEKEQKHHRTQCKTIYLGRCYEMGGGKLCKSLGLPTQWVERRGRKYEAAGEEGQRILDRFDEKAPFIRQLSWKAQDAARAKGYIKTILGRRCHFEKKLDGSGEYDFIYKALNKLVQGSSADQMKKAMVDADAAGLRLQIQVHDELDLTTETPEEGEYLAEIMRNAVPCNVPHKIDVERGTNWGNIK